jgi:GT2 family glycosyltransferase
VSDIDLSVIIVGFGDSPHLASVIDHLSLSSGISLEIIVVDNGVDHRQLEQLNTSKVRVIGPPINRGFAGGCNLGASGAVGRNVAFVNPDLFVTPGTLAALGSALDQGVADVACGVLTEPDSGNEINSAGNPVHYLGFSWAGREGSAAPGAVTEVTAASGALMAVRTEWFRQLGGFCEPMFAYYEDAELSLRTWLSGGRVVCVGAARATHHYEPNRHSTKWMLAERNRHWLTATLFSTRHLVAAAPLLVCVEIAIAIWMHSTGLGASKRAAWRWIWTNRRLISERRRTLSAERSNWPSNLSRLATGMPGTASGVRVPAWASILAAVPGRIVLRIAGAKRTAISPPAERPPARRRVDGDLAAPAPAKPSAVPSRRQRGA